MKKYVTLGEVCKLNMGQSPDSSTYNDHGEGIPFYQGNADFGDIHPVTAHWCTYPTKIAENGDILISVRAPIGALNIATEQCCIGRGLASITVDSKIVSRDYIWYALKSRVAALQAMGTGSTFKAINKNVLNDMQFLLPTLEEQANIAQNLSKIDTAINICTQLMNKLDMLVKSRFVEMFGDIVHDYNIPKVLLSELADVGSSKRIYANEYVDDGIPFYRSKEIRELGSGLKPSTELFITNERYKEIKEKYGVPKIGDILIAAIGATIGYSWIVDTESPFYYKDGNLIILSVKDNVNSVFLNHTMGILIEDFKNKGVSGSAQLALTIEKLEKMPVVNPNFVLQNQFAAFVEQTDKSKFIAINTMKIVRRVRIYDQF